MTISDGTKTRLPFVPTFLSLSPDGKHCCAASSSLLMVFLRPESGQETVTEPVVSAPLSHPLQVFSWVKDGVAFATLRTPILIRTFDGGVSEIRLEGDRTLRGSGVYSLAFDWDRNLLLAASERPNRTTIFDVPSAKIVGVRSGEGHGIAVNHKWSCTAQVRESTSPFLSFADADPPFRVLKTAVRCKPPIYGVKFSPDNEHIAILSEGRGITLRVFSFPDFVLKMERPLLGVKPDDWANGTFAFVAADICAMLSGSGEILKFSFGCDSAIGELRLDGARYIGLCEAESGGSWIAVDDMGRVEWFSCQAIGWRDANAVRSRLPGERHLANGYVGDDNFKILRLR